MICNAELRPNYFSENVSVLAVETLPEIASFLRIEFSMNYRELTIPLMNIFSQSLSTGIFPDKMKISKVSPIFKYGKKNYCIQL